MLFRLKIEETAVSKSMLKKEANASVAASDDTVTGVLVFGSIDYLCC